MNCCNVLARIADRLQERLHVIAPEAQERRPRRAVLTQQLQPGHHNRDLVEAR